MMKNVCLGNNVKRSGFQSKRQILKVFLTHSNINKRVYSNFQWEKKTCCGQLVLCMVKEISVICFFRKQKLLTREDLELPWKPVYQLVENVAYSPYEHHGLQLFPQLVYVFIYIQMDHSSQICLQIPGIIIICKFTLIDYIIYL